MSNITYANNTLNVHDEDTENKIKSIILLKSVRYIQWPIVRNRGLNICILGDGKLNKVLLSLNKLTYNKETISVESVKKGSYENCHIVYAGDPEADGYQEIINNKNKLHFLSVSDINGFAKAGGIMELFKNKNKITFKINLTNSKRHGFLIGSYFLKMVHIIK